MTRPKVPPDQRQRTAQACESCKRRKQKVWLNLLFTTHIISRFNISYAFLMQHVLAAPCVTTSLCLSRYFSPQNVSSPSI
jgi:hypothetical protein